MNADGGTFHVQTLGGDIRVSNAGQVWCDYGEALGQRRNDRLPHQRGLGIAVQQDQWCTVAFGHVMHLDAIDLCSARGDDFVCSLSVNFEEDAVRKSGPNTARPRRKFKARFMKSS